MTNDLISREALKKALNHMYDCAYIDSRSKEGIVSDVIDEIDNAPTVEEKSYAMGYQDGLEDGLDGIRPQGKWITGGKDVTGQYFYDEFICNQCFVVVTDKSNFCPKCGADMRKGGAE